eukprot:scaffold191211_cov27-Prasinocladus_malaysianus.AAC.1
MSWHSDGLRFDVLLPNKLHLHILIPAMFGEVNVFTRGLLIRLYFGPRLFADYETDCLLYSGSNHQNNTMAHAAVRNSRVGSDRGSLLLFRSSRRAMRWAHRKGPMKTAGMDRLLWRKTRRSVVSRCDFVVPLTARLLLRRPS